ncbi:MAG: hypothetical protein JJE40_09410 [Vicinamibacteria bacterium]|nr:hypothetical protein [Vicinamibacteria bacterium]
MRLVLLAFALLMLQPATGWAEWQVKPFVGATFGGTTSFLDPGQEAGKRKLALGASATWLGTFIGVEGDVVRVPGFFQDPLLVRGSSVTTLTGNLVLTLPRKYTEYGLRPYLVAGGGVVRVAIDQGEALLDVQTTMKVLDFGGGATGFLTDRIGLNWDVRYFRSVGGKEGTGLTIGGKEQISFWRATMGVAVRLGAGR